MSLFEPEDTLFEPEGPEPPQRRRHQAPGRPPDPAGPNSEPEQRRPGSELELTPLEKATKEARVQAMQAEKAAKARKRQAALANSTKDPGKALRRDESRNVRDIKSRNKNLNRVLAWSNNRKGVSKSARLRGLTRRAMGVPAVVDSAAEEKEGKEDGEGEEEEADKRKGRGSREGGGDLMRRLRCGL